MPRNCKTLSFLLFSSLLFPSLAFLQFLFSSFLPLLLSFCTLRNFLPERTACALRRLVLFDIGQNLLLHLQRKPYKLWKYRLFRFMRKICIIITYIYYNVYTYNIQHIYIIYVRTVTPLFLQFMCEDIDILYTCCPAAPKLRKIMWTKLGFDFQTWKCRHIRLRPLIAAAWLHWAMYTSQNQFYWGPVSQIEGETDRYHNPTAHLCYVLLESTCFLIFLV